MWTKASSKAREAAMEAGEWYALEDVPERFARMKGRWLFGV